MPDSDNKPTRGLSQAGDLSQRGGLPSAPQGQNNPQPSNTGVVVNFAYSIDWLNFTCPDAGLEWRNFFPTNLLPNHPAFEPTGELLRPINGYTQATSFRCGRLDWSPEHPQQKLLVTMTGKDCQQAHELGVDFQDLLAHVKYIRGGKVTRLDFAGDVFNGGGSPADIWQAWRLKVVHTSARRAKYITSEGVAGSDEGKTLYIGSPASEKKIRVYDKAKQSGVDGDWIRVELETRGAAAEALSMTMQISGIIPGGKAVLNEFVQVPSVAWFTQLLQGDACDWVEPVEIKETDRQRWYREQVLPAITRDLQAGDDWLRFAVQGALDVTEGTSGHGGTAVKTNQMSRKWRSALKALEACGFDDLLQVGLRDKGPEFSINLVQMFGYTWNTSVREWQRA